MADRKTGCFAGGCAVLLGFLLIGWIAGLVGRGGAPAAQAPAAPAAAAPARAGAQAAPAPASSCREHIELKGGAAWARELGKPEMWVLQNHRINLWSGQSPNKGRPVGSMPVGARAVILETGEDDYRVRAPSGATPPNAEGWVGKIQVARTLYQDVKTFKACRP